MDNEDLPARYRQLKDPSRKIRKGKKGTDIEKRFKANVKSWTDLISTMFAKIDEAQAWRFINLTPQLDGKETSLTMNNDFIDFIDYLILRRDKEECGKAELGGLALLLFAFQREVEKSIQSRQEAMNQ